MPGVPKDTKGSARIVEESQARVSIDYEMKEAGLIVISSLWFKGWQAFVNGKPAPVLRANAALQGVVVPPGTGRVELIYWPDGFSLGLWLSLASVTLLTVWSVSLRRSGRRGRASARVADE